MSEIHLLLADLEKSKLFSILQLFEQHPALAKDRFIYLVEENLFFTQYKFHKQKLVFHRSSMKFYEKYLVGKNYKVNYIDSGSDLSDIRKLITHLM